MPERKQTILPNREWKPLQKSSVQPEFYLNAQITMTHGGCIFLNHEWKPFQKSDSYLNARITITPWVHFLPQNTNRAELVLSVIVDLCQNTKTNARKGKSKNCNYFFYKSRIKLRGAVCNRLYLAKHH